MQILEHAVAEKGCHLQISYCRLLMPASSAAIYLWTIASIARHGLQLYHGLYRPCELLVSVNLLHPPQTSALPGLLGSFLVIPDLIAFQLVFRDRVKLFEQLAESSAEGADQLRLDVPDETRQNSQDAMRAQAAQEV